MGRSRGHLRGTRCLQEVRAPRSTHYRYQFDDVDHHARGPVDERRDGFGHYVHVTIVNDGFFLTFVEQHLRDWVDPIDFIERHRHDDKRAVGNGARQYGSIEERQRRKQQDQHDTPKRREGLTRSVDPED